MAFPAKELEPRPTSPIATDGELLMRFVRQRDRAAIGELVHKHAPMVMAVCRQILGSRPEADDAFQATFLILVKRASAIERKSSVAGWLYRVAYRTAMRLAVRRGRHRSEPLAAEPAGEPEVFSIISERETRRTLHEELARLPSRYREPILLFYFAGKTREEIAEELECTDAAVKGRLARGRKALRLALARRGVGLSVAMGATVAASTSSNAAAATLSEKTVLACTSALERSANIVSCSPKAIQLAQEGVRAMFVSTIAKLVIAPAVVGAALVALAQLPDREAETTTPAASAGQLVLASAAAELSETAGTATIRTADVDPAVIVSSTDGTRLTADALTFAAADPAAALSNSLARTSMPEPDAAMSQMLESYYEQRAEASEIRQTAKQVEIQAYSSPPADRDKLLSKAKQLELQADILDLRAESDLLSGRAKLLRERRERLENVPLRTEASTTPPATAARPVDTLQPGDRLMIQAINVFEEAPLDGEYMVEQSGTVALGPAYRRVPIAGLSLVEAELAIEDHLQEYVENPQVQVTRSSATSRPPRPQAAAAATSPLSLLPPRVETIQPGDGMTIELLGVPANTAGPYEFIVEKGGTVALGGPYGRVHVAELSREQAEVAIEDHLREFLINSQVQVTRIDADAWEKKLQSLRAEIRSLQDELESLQGHVLAD